MTTRRLLAMLVVVVAMAAVGVRARRAGAVNATRSFDVSGVVIAAPSDGSVTIAHGDIAGYMPAMTMAFPMSPGGPALAPGDRVRFILKVAEDWSRAERFEVTGRDTSIAAAAASAASGGRSVRLKKGDALPGFSLVAEDGASFTQDDLRGHLTAITFIFTRCPVPEFCPLMVKRFRQVQTEIERNQLMRDVRLVSVTLDPAFDTPAVLAAYSSAIGAHHERWRFVTGEPEAVGRLTSAFSLHVERNGPFIDHTLATAIVDGEGRVVEIWRGNGWKTDELIDGLRREASAARQTERP